MTQHPHPRTLSQEPKPEVRIERGDPAEPRTRALIEALDQYLIALYPPVSNHLVPPDQLRGPHVVFLIANLGAEPVGCGALVDRSGEYGELKRMYVRPDRRGGGIGRALLETLVAHARSRGLGMLRLETGIAQPEALALYERSGFVRRGPFGEYRDDPLSLFLERTLA